MCTNILNCTGMFDKKLNCLLHKIAKWHARKISADLAFSTLYFRTNKELIKRLSSPAPGSKDLYFPTQYQQSFFRQFIACLVKQHWSYGRNPPYNTVRFLVTVFIALMFGTMFWDLGSKT